MNLLQKSTVFNYLLLLWGGSYFAQGQEISSFKDADPFSIRGSMGANMTAGTNNALGGGQPPVLYTIYGNPVVSIYGIQIPLSFSFSRGQLAYTLPFNRFGASPKYKWLTLHAGHRNMRFNQFTLAGRTFLGAGLEMNPGKFRFAAMYGRLQDALPFTPDLLEGFRFIAPTFSRKAFAGKIGVGSERNYIDLSIFKGWDDPTSIPSIPDEFLIFPEENLALGLNFKKTLFRKIYLQAEGAASAYTQDLRKENVWEADQVPILQGLFAPKYSSRVNTAVAGGIFYTSNKFTSSLEYRRIDPNYQTMGAFYNLNDLENYTFNTSLTTFRNSTVFSASIGRERNDIASFRTSQMERWIGSLNIQYTSPKGAGIYIGYQNYSMSSGQFDPNFFNDTLRIVHQMHTIFANPNISWGDGATVHYNALLNLSYQLIDDQSPLTSEFGDMQMFTSSANFQWMRLLSGWTYSTGMQYHQIISVLSGQSRVGLTGMVAKRIKDKGINLSATMAVFQAISEVVRSGTYMSSRVNARFRITDKHSFNTGIMWISRPATIMGNIGQFNDFRVNAGYQFSF